MPTIGFIHPGTLAEEDYLLAEQLLGDDVKLSPEQFSGTDPHTAPDLFAVAKPDAVVWACTRASFAGGWEAAGDRLAKLTASVGVPVSSTSFAFTEAARALGLRRVAVASRYPADAAAEFAAFLGKGGLGVVGAPGAGTTDDVVALALGADHPAAQAVLVPDTTLRSLAAVNEIEERTGKPVLTANQVTIWAGLRLIGEHRLVRSLGALFRQRKA
ncbi:maleate cis-trans isomerase [Amycolatopsis sp. cg5]|uniref:maleate cis-trans isomerase family protein n=1 Tax=Amycolatopsis sp. cg5 TaxID=3238802 RepID=UPI00352658E0